MPKTKIYIGVVDNEGDLVMNDGTDLYELFDSKEHLKLIYEEDGCDIPSGKKIKKFKLVEIK